MTTPISGGGGSSLPGFTAIEATPSYPVLLPGLLVTLDSLEESSSSIPIIAYARAINEAIDQLKEQLGTSAVQDQEVSKKFFGVLIQRATLLQQLYYEAKKAATEQKQLVTERNAQVKQVNDQIDLYNTGVTSQYLGSWEDLKALRDLYAATLSFIDPNSANYLNESYMNQQIDLYGSLIGSPMGTLKQALIDFYDSKSPYYNDFIRLGEVLQQYFFQYSSYVVPANEQTAVDAWTAFFNSSSSDYQDISVLDSAIKAYAPFLDPSYNLIVQPAVKNINEQEETTRVNQAIADYNNPSSVYFHDTDYIALIYSQYNAYRQGTLDDVRNAINAYFAITNRTPENLDNLDDILRAYHRYIDGAPNIVASLDAYDHDLATQIQVKVDNHNELVPLSGGQFSEQKQTDLLNEAIAEYYDSSSAYYGDIDALQFAYYKYNAYRQGTLNDIESAISSYFAIQKRNPGDLDALDKILRNYSVYIPGGPAIVSNLDAYDHYLSTQLQSMLDEHNASVVLSGGEFSEQYQVNKLNSAIEQYYSASSPYYSDNNFIKEAIGQYNAYSKGTINDVLTSITNFFDTENPATYKQVTLLDPILRSYSPYIETNTNITDAVFGYYHYLSNQMQSSINDFNSELDSLDNRMIGTINSAIQKNYDPGSVIDTPSNQDFSVAVQTLNNAVDTYNNDPFKNKSNLIFAIENYFTQTNTGNNVFHYSDPDWFNPLRNAFNTLYSDEIQNLNYAVSQYNTIGSVNYKNDVYLQNAIDLYRQTTSGSGYSYSDFNVYYNNDILLNPLNNAYDSLISDKINLLNSAVDQYNDSTNSNYKNNSFLINAVESYYQSTSNSNTNYKNSAWISPLVNAYNSFASYRNVDVNELNNMITTYNSNISNLPGVESYNYDVPQYITLSSPPDDTQIVFNDIPLNSIIAPSNTAIDLDQFSTVLNDYKNELNQDPVNYLNRNSVIESFNDESSKYYTYYNQLIGEQPIKDTINFTPRNLMSSVTDVFPPPNDFRLTDREVVPDIPNQTTAPAIDIATLESDIQDYLLFIQTNPANYLNRNAAITNFNTEMPEWYNYYNILIGDQPIKNWITFVARDLLPPPPTATFPPSSGSNLPNRIKEPDLPDQTNPPAEDIEALEEDIQAYLNYINTNPTNELNRNADIKLFNDYIDQYNAEVAANNAVIDDINSTRGKLKLSNLTKQQPIDPRDLLPSPPTVYNGSQVLPGRDLYPRVPLMTDPTENDTSITDAFNTEFNEALLFIGTMSQQLNLSEIDIDYALFVFQGGNLMNPLALNPEMGSREQTGGGVAGIGYGSTAVDLSNIFVEAVLSTALLEAAYKAESIPDSPEAIEATKIATLQLLQDISLVAGAPSVAFLAGALPSISLLPYLGIDEAAVSIVFAVEYARQVRNVLLSDVPQQTIQGILATDPVFGNLTPDQIANLVGSISASLSASLGLVSLVQISIALGTPGLVAQLLSLLPGIQALGVNSLSPPIFQDFVGNGFTNSLVGSLLIGSGLDQSAAAETLRAALASGPEDPNSFFNALQKALAAAGLAPSEAISLALDATLLVLQQSPQANFTQGEMDRTLMPGVIDQKMLEEALSKEFVNAGEIAAAVFKNLNERNQIEKSVLLSNILGDFRFSDELTRGILRANLLGDTVLRDSIVRDEITQNVIRNDLVLRDIRDALVQELINRNYDVKKAFETAQDTIDGLREDYKLQLRMEQAYVDQEVLKNSIQQSFIQRGIQEDEASRRAEIVVDNLQNNRENYAARANVRAAIRDTLVEEFGIDRQQAGFIAAGVDLGIPPPEPVSLFNTGMGSMTLNQILIALETRIVSLLGGRLSVEKTEELIDRLKGIVLTDDNSLRNIIDRSATYVADTQNEELIHSLVNEVRELTKPTREIFAFMEKLRDPGNALIYSVWSGIMYGQDQPSNYKRDIDIHV